MAKAKSVSTAEIGIAYSAYDRSGRGDSEFIPKLRGLSGVRTYRQMAENDATINAVMFAVEMSIRNVDWRITENETNGTNDEDVEFVRSVLFDDMSHSFIDYISEALSFLVYGWTVHEIVYKMRNADEGTESGAASIYNDGKIGIDKLSLRSQSSLHRWIFSKEGHVQGLEQFTTTKGIVKIPLSKCVYLRTNSYEAAPEGKSILRGAYRSWYYLRHLEQIESTAIERELNGLPVIYIPGELLVAAQNGEVNAMRTVKQYEQAVRDVKLNEQGSLVLPSDVYYNTNGELTNSRKVIFELVASNGTRNIDTNTVISRYQANIMRTVLSDFIMLGTSAGSSGSHALSGDRSRLFADALSGWLDIVTETINRTLVGKLWQLNGMDMKKVPRLDHGSVSRETLTSLADYIRLLSAAGMPLFPDEDLESYLRRRADLPQASSEFNEMQAEMREQEQEMEMAGQNKPANTKQGDLETGKKKDYKKDPGAK